MAKVMLVGIKKSDEKKLEGFFKSVGVACDKIPNLESAMERIAGDPPTVIVAEKPEGLEPLQSLQAVLKTSAPATPFLVTLSKNSIPLALESMRAGAYDCLARPLERLDVLAAAKRAALANGRTLFVAKVRPKRRQWDTALLVVLLCLVIASGVKSQRNGPPEPTLSLGSATLSGIQWDERNLWVGNWFDSTVTHYRLTQGFLKKQRTLETDAIYRMQDSQPILVCDTPEALVTVGFDLKIRLHQRAVGLPTLLTTSAPGSNPTGLAWDGEYLWSTDGQTGLLYKHGSDLKVLETMPSIIPQPSGLACDGVSMWVMGGTPLRLARLEQYGFGHVWRGPYLVPQLVPEGITVSGGAVGFGRLWTVSGGDPRMNSLALTDIMSGKNQSWVTRLARGEKK